MENRWLPSTNLQQKTVKIFEKGRFLLGGIMTNLSIITDLYLKRTLPLQVAWSLLAIITE